MIGGNTSAGVAIAGIACRFPGAPDHFTFWQNLCEGVESISALSDEDPSDASDKDFNRGHRERYWGLPKPGEFSASCGMTPSSFSPIY